MKKMSKKNPCDAQGGGAEKKFWSSPDLMEKFLLYIQPADILSVASVWPSCSIIKILEDSENPSIWSKLINRTLKENNPEEEEKRRVKDLTKILKLMKSPQATELLNLVKQN